MKGLYLVMHGFPDDDGCLSPDGIESVKRLLGLLDDGFPKDAEYSLSSPLAGCCYDTAKLFSEFLAEKTGKQVSITSDGRLSPGTSEPCSRARRKLLDALSRQNIPFLHDPYYNGDICIIVSHEEIIMPLLSSIAKQYGIKLPDFLQPREYTADTEEELAECLVPRICPAQAFGISSEAKTVDYVVADT